MSFCFQWMEILIEGSLSTPFLFVFHRQGGNRVYFSLGQTCEVGLGERNIRRWWWVQTLVVESNSIFVFIARKTRLVRCLGRSSRRRHRNCFRAKGFSCLFVFVSCHQNEMQASFYRGSWWISWRGRRSNSTNRTAAGCIGRCEWISTTPDCLWWSSWACSRRLRRLVPGKKETNIFKKIRFDRNARRTS